jgi:hypothetical protein
MQRAERDLARARRGADDGDPASAATFTAATFTAAISSLRELSTPYHLAHGLLEHAGHLTRLGDAAAAAADIDEAREIAGSLRCQPLLDQAANSRLQSPWQRIRLRLPTWEDVPRPLRHFGRSAPASRTDRPSPRRPARHPAPPPARAAGPG